MTRFAALHPGELRREEQRIGVRTVHGDHMPPALDMAALQLLIDDTVTGPSLTPADAARLFVVLARAQPFEDGRAIDAVVEFMLAHQAAEWK